MLCVNMSSFESYDFLLTSHEEASYSPDGSPFTISCKDLSHEKTSFALFPTYFIELFQRFKTTIQVMRQTFWIKRTIHAMKSLTFSSSMVEKHISVPLKWSDDIKNLTNLLKCQHQCTKSYNNR